MEIVSPIMTTISPRLAEVIWKIYDIDIEQLVKFRENFHLNAVLKTVAVFRPDGLWTTTRFLICTDPSEITEHELNRLAKRDSLIRRAYNIFFDESLSSGISRTQSDPVKYVHFVCPNKAELDNSGEDALIQEETANQLLLSDAKCLSEPALLHVNNDISTDAESTAAATDESIATLEEIESATSQLFAAVARGHVNTVEELLESGLVDIDQLNENSQAPLHVAALHRQLAVIKVLLKRGADVFIRDDRGLTSLHLAVQKNYHDVVRQLVDFNPTLIGAVDNYNRTPLQIASQGAHSNSQGNAKRIISFLYSKTLLNYNCGRIPIIAKGVLVPGANVNSRIRNHCNRPIISQAAFEGNLDAVKILARQGADVYAITNPQCCGNTPLMLAVSGGHLSVVKFLAENFPDLIHKGNKDGLTALDFAKQYQQAAIRNYLKSLIHQEQQL